MVAGTTHRRALQLCPAPESCRNTPHSRSSYPGQAVPQTRQTRQTSVSVTNCPPTSTSPCPRDLPHVAHAPDPRQSRGAHGCPPKSGLKTGDALRAVEVAERRNANYINGLRHLRCGRPGTPPAPRVARPLAESARLGRVCRQARPGYPKPPVPPGEAMPKALKERTLTNFCSVFPRWLADAHDLLDAAVVAAYGWQDDQLRPRGLARTNWYCTARAVSKARCRVALPGLGRSGRVPRRERESPKQSGLRRRHCEEATSKWLWRHRSRSSCRRGRDAARTRSIGP